MYVRQGMRGVLLIMWMICSMIVLGQDSQDFFQFRADQLSDDQIRQMLLRANEAGYTEQDLFLYAQTQGIPDSEILILQERIADLDNAKRPETSVVESPTVETEKEVMIESEPDPIAYFGYDLFRRTGAVSFEATGQGSVPDNYVIGPTDELIINIYGESERNYQETISNRGYLLLRNIGPVFLSGLSLKEAELKVKNSLSTIYADLLSENPKTYVQLSVSKVRTIGVNLVGELQTPGTYTVNGLSTVFNAIYAAGGPTLKGTLRDIRVFRDDKLITTLDYYDFLIKGSAGANIRLRNNDLILVGTYQNRVSIEGEVKRPGIFEMKNGETFEDLLSYAGGFSAEAYRDRISVTRNTRNDKVISDLFNEQFQLFETRAGDEYQVGQILNRYKNRVSISGAVFRPGNYALSENLTVRKLIDRAEGLRGEAFLGRAILTRTNEDLNSNVLALDLGAILRGEAPDIALMREDRIDVLSIHDLTKEQYVEISGEVKFPGIYNFSSGLSLNDLILLASGLTELASEGTIEISRRPEEQSVDRLSEIFLESITKDMSISNGEFQLEPFDHVIVRRDPNFYQEKKVQVFGEIEFPGDYVLTSEGDRISDVLKRAGEIKSTVYLNGATLLRKTEFFNNDEQSAGMRGNNGSLEDGLLDPFFTGRTESIQNQEVTTQAKQERLEELSRNNPFLDIEIRETESIALDMDAILSNPGGFHDLILEEGDIINLPKELKTIRMRGRVLYPNAVRFEKGKGLKYFIGKAGGFGNRAHKKQTYVVYANGEVSRTRGFLFFKSYPKPEPGAEVIIPTKPIKVPIKPTEFIGITSGLATIALLITQIVP